MKQISSEEASTYLRLVGLTVGDWKQITSVDAKSQTTWRVLRPPANAQQLFVLSLHLADWLPKAQWKVLQFDYSNFMRPYQTALFARLLSGRYEARIHLESNAFLFEFGDKPEADFAENLAIASAIHALLLFEGNGYIATSNQDRRDYLGLQEGSIYLLADPARIADAETFIADMQGELQRLPLWATWEP